MSRVLLVDDSPHAQRMGERILTEEGYEVVTVSNADSALVRLDDVDPDVVLADTVMPGRTGFEICQYLKMSPRHKHVRVILTAGVLEPLDEAHTKRVEADGILKKPFEASALLAAVKPLAEAAVRAREGNAASGGPGKGEAANAPVSTAPFIAVVDAEQVRAAVTIAMDASMDTLVDEIARRVLATLNSTKKPDPRPLESSVPPPAAAPVPAPPVPAAPPRLAEPGPIAPPAASEPITPITPVAPRVQSTRIEPVRRISPLRLRTGAILGIDINRPEPPELPPADTNSPADE